MEDIKQATIPKWFAVELDMLTFVEVHMHAPFLQCRICLGGPANTGLTIATGRPAKYPANIIETAPLPAIELDLALFPVQF